MKRIVECTLAYAESILLEKPVLYQRFSSVSLSKSKVYCFIGCLLLLGLLSVRNYRYAWSTKSAQTVIKLSEFMTYSQCEYINYFLHLLTPAEEQALSGNCLCKILLMYNFLKS